MSTINKKPFIKLVLESMSEEEVATLSALIDGSGNQTALLRTMSNKPVGNRTNITSADKGVHLCNLEVGFTLFQGYLIYTDSYCVLIHFTDSQVLGMFDIDLNDLTSYATVSEALNVLELRSEVYDIANKGGSVETEPVINILMTNMDVTGIDSTEPRKIADLHLFCSKKRWDDFVVLTKSLFQLDITYDNLNTLFKTFDSNTQALVIGYLMMDCFSNKTLPRTYVTTFDSASGLTYKFYLVESDTIKSVVTNNIETVVIGFFQGSSGGEAHGVIPSMDISGNYYTVDTVITVEEIDGVIVGASNSDSTPGIDYINLQTRKALQFQIKISLKHGELEAHKELLNNGITAANTQYGLSIPLFNELDDLITIFEYIEGLGNQTLYDTLMASFLFIVNYYALSITTVYWDSSNGQSLNAPTQIHANSGLGTYEIEVVSAEDMIPTVTINGVTYNVDFSNSFIVLVPVAESGKNHTYNIRINAMD